MEAPRPTALITEVKIFEPDTQETTAVEEEVFDDPTLSISWIKSKFGQGKTIHVYHWFLEENPHPSKVEYEYIRRKFISKNDEPFYEVVINQVADSWGSWSQPSPWRGWAVASHELGNHFNTDFYNAALGLGDNVVKKASSETPSATIIVSGPAIVNEEDSNWWQGPKPSKDLNWFPSGGAWEADVSDPHQAFKEAERLKGPGVNIHIKFQTLEQDPGNPNNLLVRDFFSVDGSDWREEARSQPKESWYYPESAVPYLGEFVKKKAARQPQTIVYIAGADKADIPDEFERGNFALPPPFSHLLDYYYANFWDPAQAFNVANNEIGTGRVVIVSFAFGEFDENDPDFEFFRYFVSEDGRPFREVRSEKEDLRNRTRYDFLEPIPYLGEFVKKADIVQVEPTTRVWVYGLNSVDLPGGFKVYGENAAFADYSDPVKALEIAKELRGEGVKVRIILLKDEQSDENPYIFLRREWISINGGPWQENVQFLKENEIIGPTLPYLGELVPTNKTASSKMKKKALNQEIDFKTEVILLLSARLLNNYMASYLLRMRKQGLSEAMWQEAIDDAQEASTCGVNSDDDFSAWFYIDHFVEDLVKELMGIKLEENEEEDLKCFMFKMREQLDYRHPEGYKEAVKRWVDSKRVEKKASVSGLETVVDELNELVGMVETEFGAQQINDLFTSLNSDLERFAFYSENDELWILSGSGFSVPFLVPTIEASYEETVGHILDNYIKLMEQLGFDKNKLNIEIIDDDRGYDYPRFRIYDNNVRVGQIYKPGSFVQDRWNMFGGPFDKKSELEGIIGRINLTKNLLLGDATAYKMMQDVRRDFAPPTVVEPNPTAINQILTNLASFIEKAAADNRYQDLYHLAIILRRLINFAEKTKLKTHPYFPLTQPEHLSEFEKYDGLRQEYKEKAQPAPSATSTKKASSGDLVNTSQLNTEVWIYNMDPEDAPTDIRKFPDPKLAFEFAKGRTGPGIVVEVRFNFYEKAHDVLKRRGYISVDDGDFDMVELGLDPELPLRGVPWLADYPYRQTIKNAHPNIGKPYSPLQKYDMEKWKATVIKIQKTIRLGFSQEFALKEASELLPSPEKYDFLMWYNYHLSGVPDKYNVNDEIKAKNRQLRNYYDVN